MRQLTIIYHSFFYMCILLTALAIGAPAYATETATINLLYTADMQGHVLPGKDTIGLAKIAAYKKSLSNAILLDAGDFLHGTPMATFSQGKDIVTLMKAAGYNAATLGNHEFDYGLDVLRQRVQEARAVPDTMEILSANVMAAPDKPLGTPWIILPVEGVNVGIVGITTEEVQEISAPAVRKELLFYSAETTISNEYINMSAAGADIFIALAHVGSSADNHYKGSFLAKEASYMDIIIDGHSHVLLEEPNPRSAHLYSPEAFGKYLGHITIRYDKHNKRVTSIQNTLLSAADMEHIIPDQTVQALLENSTARMEAALSTPVARTTKELAFPGTPAMRTQETTLGNFTADALRFVTKSDIGLMNSGSLQAGLPKGNITRKDLLTCLPFNNSVVRMLLTKSELARVLEQAYSSLPEAHGRFLQVSGLTVTIDISRPAGSRVQKITLSNGRPLEHGKKYSVALNSFIAQGGDGFHMLARKPAQYTGIADTEAVVLLLTSAQHDKYPAARKRILYKR